MRSPDNVPCIFSAAATRLLLEGVAIVAVQRDAARMALEIHRIPCKFAADQRRWCKGGLARDCMHSHTVPYLARISLEKSGGEKARCLRVMHVGGDES
jgi:hypothetical protein